MALNESGWIYIQLNSGDPSVKTGQTATNFSNTMPVPIDLDSGSNYEVCMLSCMFPNYQPLPSVNYYQPIGEETGDIVGPTPTPVQPAGESVKSVYVNCSLCQESIIGNQQTNVLCWIPSSVIIDNGCVNSNDGTLKNKNVFYAPFLTRVWQPCTIKYFTEITISLTDSIGNLLTTTNNDFVTVILAIRKSD